MRIKIVLDRREIETAIQHWIRTASPSRTLIGENTGKISVQLTYSPGYSGQPDSPREEFMAEVEIT